MRTYVLLAMIGCGALVAGCAKSGSSGAPAAASTAAAEPHYPLTGEVLSVDATHHTVRVRHDEVKGLMPAMTMDFAVSPGDALLVKPGEKIRGELIPTKEGDFRLEKIFPNDKVADDTVAAVARQLREDTGNRGKHAYREVGEQVPDFALYDQSGQVVQMSRFRGKQIMLNFIYTRCPVANMCPAATMKMMETQKLARAAHVDNLELVSITLDPAYDTPGVLKEYAAARGIDTSNFSFLTGPESAIKDLLVQFGVIAEFEGDLLKHTLTTLLIDGNGKIIYRADGSIWEPKDFVAKMRKSSGA
jgi:protein SCO1/2